MGQLNSALLFGTFGSGASCFKSHFIYVRFTNDEPENAFHFDFPLPFRGREGILNKA